MLRKINKLLKFAIDLSTTIPFPHIPNTTAEYQKNISAFLIIKKYLHKYLKLKFGSQLPLLKSSIQTEQVSRALWVYTAKQNIGDAIMDLSGRALLQDKIQIDLLCSDALLSVFDGDRFFSEVSSNAEALKNKPYDLIIVSEFNYPSIKIKTRFFSRTPMVCLFAFFYGPDRNQVLFSHFAVNKIFNLNETTDHILKIAKPCLSYRNPSNHNPLERGALAIAVGGIDLTRSYQHWSEVIRLLDNQCPENLTQIVLLGSMNGKEAAEKIMALGLKNLKLSDYVGKLSIKETHQKLCDSRLLVACDGGLMHLAHTTDIPSISIFRNQEVPEMRLTQATKGIRFHSSGSVSDISPEELYTGILRYWKSLSKESTS